MQDFLTFNSIWDAQESLESRKTPTCFSEPNICEDRTQSCFFFVKSTIDVLLRLATPTLYYLKSPLHQVEKGAKLSRPQINELENRYHWVAWIAYLLREPTKVAIRLLFGGIWKHLIYESQRDAILSKISMIDVIRKCLQYCDKYLKSGYENIKIFIILFETFLHHPFTINIYVQPSMSWRYPQTYHILIPHTISTPQYWFDSTTL